MDNNKTKSVINNDAINRSLNAIGIVGTTADLLEKKGRVIAIHLKEDKEIIVALREDVVSWMLKVDRAKGEENQYLLTEGIVTGGIALYAGLEEKDGKYIVTNVINSYYPDRKNVDRNILNILGAIKVRCSVDNDNASYFYLKIKTRMFHYVGGSFGDRVRDMYAMTDIGIMTITDPVSHDKDWDIRKIAIGFSDKGNKADVVYRKYITDAFIINKTLNPINMDKIFKEGCSDDEDATVRKPVFVGMCFRGSNKAIGFVREDIFKYHTTVKEYISKDKSIVENATIKKGSYLIMAAIPGTTPYCYLTDEAELVGAGLMYKEDGTYSKAYCSSLEKYTGYRIVLLNGNGALSNLMAVITKGKKQKEEKKKEKEKPSVAVSFLIK